jgi:hypothetical protein
MDSVRKGLRAGDIDKDTYDRLVCGECGSDLGTRDDPGEVFSVRYCPECESEWKQL